MKKVKFITLIIMVLVSSLILSSCGIAKVDNAVYKTPKEFSPSDGLTITENEEYIFELAGEDATVMLKSKSGKILWATSPLESFEEKLDEYGDPVKLHSKLKSSIIIEYVEPTTSKISIAYSYKNCVENGNYSVKKIDNGIEITYYFEEVKISVPVQYTFEDNVVRVSVDSARITEDEFSLYSVALAPYSCGIDNLSENGYLFIPSGSGAIVEPCQLAEGFYSYSRELYGNDVARYRERELDTEKFPENRLAVYGAKTSADSAFCAIIENGAEHAFIEAEVGAANTGYSSVWAKFAFRAYQWSKIKNEQQVKLYSNDMSQDTVSVAFHLLRGENANYVGMADTYREFLKENHSMKSSVKDSLLNLKIVGGVNITETFLGFKYDKFFATTTLAEAEDMISELKAQVNGTVNADLIGFGKSGIDVKTIAGGYSVNSKLGGKGGLKDLASFAKENDCNLFFNADVIGVGKSGSGISKSSDTALSQDKRKIKQYYYNIYLRKKTSDFSPYLLVLRELIPEITEKLTDKLGDTGIKGFGLDTLSSVCYSDYSKVKYFNKGNMASDVSKAIVSVKKSGYAVAVNEANDYAAAGSDVIYDVPLTSSKNNMFSYDVPFYGIVFKGYVPLSTTSVNLSADNNKMILRAAEIGAGLSYTLINNGSTKLFDSFSSAFYGSVYDDIKDDIKADIKAYGEDFQMISNAKISGHSILENGLHKTVFDNGVTVYINYTASDLEQDGNIIKAESYLFCKGVK